LRFIPNTQLPPCCAILQEKTIQLTYILIDHFYEQKKDKEPKEKEKEAEKENKEGEEPPKPEAPESATLPSPRNASKTTSVPLRQTRYRILASAHGCDTLVTCFSQRPKAQFHHLGS